MCLDLKNAMTNIKNSKIKIKYRYNVRVPKVLLIGNGFYRIYNEGSWNELIEGLKDSKYKDKAESYIIPEPLKVVALAPKMDALELNKEVKNKLNAGCYIKVLEELLKLNFDLILTTNYTYEIERTLKKKGTRIVTKKKYTHERYLLHKYTLIDNNKIWHIHGELNKPSSLILSEYSYGVLLSKIYKTIESNTTRFFKRKINNGFNIDNWVDAFILGDVYSIGLGLSMSEVDLWWLLGKKEKYKFSGKTVVYNPKPFKKRNVEEEKQNMKEYNDKNILLNSMNVETKNLGKRISKNFSYEDFYYECIKDVKKNM